MTTHTPGPWSECWIAGELIVRRRIPDTNRSRTVCRVRDKRAAKDKKAEDEANARLISACPDMLAALQNILNGIETGVITSDHDETLANAADKARAAIAKAKKGD